jgi:inosine/xanthosine triphosphate pyrophosphatase family protein
VATEEEKNRVSHRARAIEDLLAKLQGKQWKVI